MATMTPFDDDTNPSQTRLPWMALVIIAMTTILVGWIVFTSNPSIADTSESPNEAAVQSAEPPA